MRCICCNRALSDFEATRRHAETKEFLDMCNACFAAVDETVHIPHIDRKDLLQESDTYDEGVDSYDEL